MSDTYVSTFPLPQGSVTQHSVLVVAFFDSEGETRYGIRTCGN